MFFCFGFFENIETREEVGRCLMLRKDSKRPCFIAISQVDGERYLVYRYVVMSCIAGHPDLVQDFLRYVVARANPRFAMSFDRVRRDRTSTTFEEFFQHLDPWNEESREFVR